MNAAVAKPLRRAQQLALLERYEPLVRKIAGGFQRKLPRNVLREDLIAAGMVGLWDAIRRQVGPLEDSFEWYVRVRIRGAILDEMRAQDWLPRRARARVAANVGTDAHVPPPAVVRLDDLSDWEQRAALAEESGLELEAISSERHELLTMAIARMRTRDRAILLAILAGQKHRDIAAAHGVSEPRISQIWTRLVRTLRRELAPAGALGADAVRPTRDWTAFAAAYSRGK